VAGESPPGPSGKGIAVGVHDFEPIAARSTVQDAVHHRLREALMAVRYDPGQALTIAALAATQACRSSAL